MGFGHTNKQINPVSSVQVNNTKYSNGKVALNNASPEGEGGGASFPGPAPGQI